MWELICHHTYDWHGLPIDRSVYDNHGDESGVGVLPDGVAQGSGAVRFPVGSGIAVPLHPTCHPLRAIKVECTIRLTDPNRTRRTLIDCPGSFKFFIFKSSLWAVHAVQPHDPGIYFGVFGEPGFHSDGVSTVTDGLGGPPYQVPLQQWVNLAFEHDGVSAMRLYADGRLIAERHVVLGGVRPAGAAGVRIGNAYGGADEALGGDIDELKLWRLDPRAMWKEFAQRPIDEKTAACWHDFLLRIEEILRAHPDCVRLLSGLHEAILRLSRVIAAHGPDAIARHARFGDAYRQLWHSGSIDGPEMAKVVKEWVEWMRSLGVAPEADPELQALFASDCFRRLWETSPGLQCDERFIGIMDLFIRAAQPRRGRGAASARRRSAKPASTD